MMQDIINRLFQECSNVTIVTPTISPAFLPNPSSSNVSGLSKSLSVLKVSLQMMYTMLSPQDLPRSR